MHNTGYSGITNLTIAKHLKRTFTEAEKSLVDDLISQVEAELCSRTNREWDYTAEYTEKLDPSKRTIYPKNYPLNNIVSIKLDGADYPLTTSNHFIYDTYIEFAETLNANKQGIEIKYKIAKFYGEELKKLLIKWISYEFLNSENAGVGLESMSFAEVSQNFDLKNFIHEREQYISKFRINNL